MTKIDSVAADEIILDHYRNPRHRAPNASTPSMPASTSQCTRASGDNPACGDHLEITIQLDGERIRDISFDGRGCAVSQSSASMMCEALIGAPLDEARRRIGDFARLLNGETELVGACNLGDAQALASLAAFPTRRVCAELAWQIANRALPSKK